MNWWERKMYMEKEKQIKSSDWLIKGYSKEELSEMKAKAIEEAEQELREKQIEQLAKDIIRAETEFGKTGKPVLDIEKYVAKHLTEQGYFKQEWISVDDMLPETHETVLVFINTENYSFISTDFIGSFGIWYDNITGVTHWQPLPTPPKMKGAE